jgi:two-component system, cell cycle response regulator DivK
MESRSTVLVVEDQDDASTPMCAILEAEGYHCHLAETGRRAVTEARRLRPAVILLDIDLPDISGIEVIEALRAEGALGSSCVVAVTGHTDEATQQHCRDAGVQAFLSKPIHPDQLLRMVALAAAAVEKPPSPSAG